jgi:hypothetical protein
MPGPGIPELKWGTFFDREGKAHVAPTIDSFLMEGHKLNLKCFCNPLVQRGPNYEIIVHYVVH